MVILSQIGDLFDKMMWFAILVVGLSSPLIGLSGNWLLFREKVHATRWLCLAVYYSAAIVSLSLCFLVPISAIPKRWVNLWELATFLPLLLLAAIGAIFGLCLLLKR